MDSNHRPIKLKANCSTAELTARNLYREGANLTAYEQKASPENYRSRREDDLNSVIGYR